MVNNCANPKCSKPLHYLREGRIFVFDVISPLNADGKRGHRLEHFWLCGACSTAYQLEQTSDRQVKLTPKRSLRPVGTRGGYIDNVLAS